MTSWLTQALVIKTLVTELSAQGPLKPEHTLVTAVALVKHSVPPRRAIALLSRTPHPLCADPLLHRRTLSRQAGHLDTTYVTSEPSYGKESASRFEIF